VNPMLFLVLLLSLIRGDYQVLGTTPENIDFAEDRQKHSAMLDSLGIDQVPSFLV
jgi:carbamoyl-phosphate synthase large subunit